jgi:hypothetical protein
MNTFRCYLWREWREHRFALLALTVVLPAATALLSWPLARGQVADPLFQGAVAAGFALVMLVVVGGELLAAERRGKVHGWLERLPGGLDAAFRAKIVFFAATLVVATLAGFGTAELAALARGAVVGTGDPLLVWSAVVAVGVWTFAAATWTQRGGLAVLGAVLVLSALLFPVWRIVTLGYSPHQAEVIVFACWLVPSALVGAALGYVRGTSLGRGSFTPALLCLAPALPLLGLTFGWSEWRLAQRAHFEPEAANFELASTHLSRDGRFALTIGSHRLPRWNGVPLHAVRIDLVEGLWEPLGEVLYTLELTREGLDGMPEKDQVCLVFQGEATRCFSLADGTLKGWESRTRDFDGRPVGLGARCVKRGEWYFRDPFRGQSYFTDELPEVIRKRQILIRPGRWLVWKEELGWHWFDPDTKELEAVNWTPEARPLVVLKDGGVLIRDADGLRLEHPERGEVRQIDTHGIDPEQLYENWNYARALGVFSLNPHQDDGPILLQTANREHEVLMIDPVTGASHRIDPGELVMPLARSGSDALVVLRMESRKLARLDLADGRLTNLFGADSGE